MVQMLFFLRFRSQLRRTRTEIVTRLEDTVTEAIFTAGGRLSDNRRFLNASFDSDRIGFWVDMLILIESVLDAFHKFRPELSGFALILDENIPEDEAERLCRNFSSSAAVSHTGVWFGEPVRSALQSFCEYKKPFRGYSELIEFRMPEINTAVNLPMERFAKILDEKRNTLIPGLTGLKESVCQFYNSELKDIPPLVIRFATVDNKPCFGPICFSDALTARIRTALAASFLKEDIEELDVLAELLFRERLGTEMSPFIYEAGKRFLSLLLHSFAVMARRRHLTALVILEDPMMADENSLKIFLEVYESVRKSENSLLLIGLDSNPSTGSSSEKDDLKEWDSVFSRVLRISEDEYQVQNSYLSGLPVDLWEILYAVYLLGRFFPASNFTQLFKEEGVNPGILDKALKILELNGVIDSITEPRPKIPNFAQQAERVLGKRKEKIKSMVRARLLAWELANKIRPCFNLLCVLNDLGGNTDDSLILRAIRSDINNGTNNELNEAFDNKQIRFLAKEESVSVLKWVLRTSKSLVLEKHDKIREAFKTPAPILPDSVFPGYRAQVLANLSSYKLGVRDIHGAAEPIKGLMLLNQNLKDGEIPSYRYFSFLNLFRQKMDDTLEYSSFAVDLAEKSGHEEYVKALYFSSSVNLLYGNISRAQRLIVKAEKTALDLGQPEWALRSRFFLGRCLFEGGHYSEALDVFSSLEYKVPSFAEPVLAAWIFRTKIYHLVVSNKSPKKIQEDPVFSCGDSRLFYPEAAYLLGNYEEAVSIGEEFLSSVDFPDYSHYEDDFFFTEQPDWRSGFSQCEYMFMPQKVFHNRHISAYQILAKSSLPISPEEGEVLNERIQRLVREEILPDGDTGDVFCLYAWYRILRKTGAPHGDANTAVSMAYRRLQRRSGRIDSSESRQDYLSMNYWSSALCLAAKENKLI